MGNTLQAARFIAFSLWDLLLLVVFFLLFLVGITLLVKNYPALERFFISKKDTGTDCLKIFCTYSLVLLLAWLPYVIVFAPGLLPHDTLWSLRYTSEMLNGRTIFPFSTPSMWAFSQSLGWALEM
jgi:hypothetical protein